MKKSSVVLGLLLLTAVILLGFIAGKLAAPPAAAPTYTPYPTYTPIIPAPTHTPVVRRANQWPITLIVKNYPRVDGSTSTYPLQVRILCDIYNLSCGWVGAGEGSERRIEPFNVDTSSLPQIKHTGTHQAYLNLINGDVDLILEARLPSQEELDLANAKGVKLDIQPIALDAFVFLVNIENPVDNISVNEIRGVYTGEITNWITLGGNDAIIQPYQRDANSGSQELMKSLVMHDTPMVDAPDMMIQGMGLLLNAVESDPDGLGYSVYYYVTYQWESHGRTKVLAVNGVHPLFETIKDRSYPLVSEVYIVIRDEYKPETYSATLLRDYLLSSEGQSVVRGSGYVPIR
jgi:phosphate transport system substrate-binding protein